jgi:chromosome segregation ATPase
MNVPAIPSDVRERVVSAANTLYEQAGRETFPTVDQVRRTAKVDMNAASAVMREWRRQQTVQAAPVAVTIPEGVQLAHSQALAALWMQAQELANESLRTAQTAWETERTELDAMRQEMATAYETQATELEATQERATEIQHAADAAAEGYTKELAAVREQLAAATTRAERAEARVAEIEKRADGLQGELTRAHQDADQVRGELESLRKDSAAEIERLRSELAGVRAKAEAAEEAHQAQRKTAAAEAHRAAELLTNAQAERDTARQQAGEAREGAAKLAGQLEAVQSQNAALLATLKPGKK